MKSVLDLQTIVYISKNVYVWISSKSSCFFYCCCYDWMFKFPRNWRWVSWNGRKTTKDNRSNLEDYAIIRELKFFKLNAAGILRLTCLRYVLIELNRQCFEYTHVVKLSNDFVEYLISINERNFTVLHESDTEIIELVVN